MIVTLNYYRRHGLNCEGEHAAGTCTSEPEERKKGWARCKCLIYASGSLNRKAKRLATKQTDWQAARDLMAPYIEANSWEPEQKPTDFCPPPSQPPTSPAPTSPAAVTIEEAARLYRLNKEGRGVTKSTMAKYRTFTGQLLRFASDKGITHVGNLQVTDVDAFYATWKDGKNSKGKKLERMKGFFQFCQKRKWITENPAEDLEPPVNYSAHKQKSPFTDDELERIFDAASRWKPCPWHNAGQRGVITAEMVIAFIMLLTETGLRISDAATFNVRDRINVDTQECFLFQHKTGKPLFTWINPDLLGRLVTLSNQLGPTPFITQSLDPQQAGDAWRERLAKIFFEAGPFAEHPVPHRFRHTFTRILLQRGVQIEEVAELVGDTPEMVRRHYARWVPERQERLTAIMKAAYEDSLQKKWRGKVVPMKRAKQG